MKYLAVLLAAVLASSASAQTLRVSGAANKALTVGFDTATKEHVFCVHWHEIDDTTVSLDSAYEAKTDSADALHVWYHACPRLRATAHWHLLDLGGIRYRSNVDSATLVQYPAPFGVLILRGKKGDKIPLNYIYYDR